MDKQDRIDTVKFFVIMFVFGLLGYHSIFHMNKKDIKQDRIESIRIEAYSMGYRDAVRDLSE